MAETTLIQATALKCLNELQQLLEEPKLDTDQIRGITYNDKKRRYEISSKVKGTATVYDMLADISRYAAQYAPRLAKEETPNVDQLNLLMLRIFSANSTNLKLRRPSLVLFSQFQFQSGVTIPTGKKGVVKDVESTLDLIDSYALFLDSELQKRCDSGLIADGHRELSEALVKYKTLPLTSVRSCRKALVQMSQDIPLLDKYCQNSFSVDKRKITRLHNALLKYNKNHDTVTNSPTKAKLNR